MCTFWKLQQRPPDPHPKAPDRYEEFLHFDARLSPHLRWAFLQFRPSVPFRQPLRSVPSAAASPPFVRSGPRAGGVALLLPKTLPPRVSSAGSWQGAAALASPGVPPPSTASPPFRALGPTRPPPPPGTDPSVRRRLPLVAKVAAARSPAQRAPPQPDEASCTSSSYRYGSSSASRG